MLCAHNKQSRAKKGILFLAKSSRVFFFLSFLLKNGRAIRLPKEVITMKKTPSFNAFLPRLLTGRFYCGVRRHGRSQQNANSRSNQKSNKKISRLRWETDWKWANRLGDKGQGRDADRYKSNNSPQRERKKKKEKEKTSRTRKTRRGGERVRSANSCDCGKNYKRQLHQTPFHKSFLALSSTSGFGRVILEKQGSASIGGEPFRRRSAIYSVRSWLMPSLSPCRFAFLLLGKWPPLKNKKEPTRNDYRLWMEKMQLVW